MKRTLILCIALAPAGLRAQATGSSAPFFLLTQQARTAFTVEGAGARAMGMGGAFTALADDATAVSYNPAGLAQLLRPEVSAVVQGFDRSLDFTGFTGVSGGSLTSFENTSNRDRHANLSFASFAVPWKAGTRNLVFLLSYQRVFDFTYNSDLAYLASTDYGLTSQAIAQQVHQSGDTAVYSAAAGLELSHHILLGAALNRFDGSAAFSSLSRKATTGVDLLYDSDLAQSSRFFGTNATLGLIWRSQILNLGLTWRTPFKATYTFANDYTYVNATTGALARESSGDTACSLNWPETWSAGLGLHLGPRLQVTADWSTTPWSQARFTGSGPALDGLNWFDLQAASRIPKVTDRRMGVEWIAVARPGLVVPLRAGAFREPQPIVDPLTGAQRVLEGWTVGAGVKFKDLTLDAALKVSHDHRYVSRYNTDAPIGGVAATSYGYERLAERRAYLSVIYQFQTEAVQRAILKVLE